MRSTPKGSEWKCDFCRRTSEGGTRTSWPFLSCAGTGWGAGESVRESLSRRSEKEREREGRAHLAVLERAGVQAHGAVTEEGLHLGDEEVALLEESAHLQFVRLEFPSLRAREGGRGEVRNCVRRADAREGERAWTPPGRLMDESMRTAFCEACVSTFHRLGPTWKWEMQEGQDRVGGRASERERKRTSTMRPTTRSPTSPRYLGVVRERVSERGAREDTAEGEGGRDGALCPQGPDRDELVDAFECACDAGEDLVVVDVSAMTPVSRCGGQLQ